MTSCLKLPPQDFPTTINGPPWNSNLKTHAPSFKFSCGRVSTPRRQAIKTRTLCLPFFILKFLINMNQIYALRCAHSGTVFILYVGGSGLISLDNKNTSKHIPMGFSVVFQCLRTRMLIVFSLSSSIHLHFPTASNRQPG